MVSRRLEIVGVRAVIQDVSKYITDARRVEDANRRIGIASENLDKITTRAANAATAHAAAQVKAQDKIAAATIATNKRIAAQAAVNRNSLLISPLPNVDQALTQARKEEAQAIKDLDRAGRELLASGRIELALKEQQINKTRALTQAERQLEAAKLAQKKSLILGAAVVGTAAAVGLGTASVSQAGKFETTLTKIDNLTELTTEEVQRLGKEITNMVGKFPKSADELGQAAFLALSSGLETVEQGINATTESAKLSVITGGDLAQTAKALTSIIAGYGQENITAAQATDVLTVAIRRGKAEPADFATNLGRMIGIAKILGVPLDQLSGIFAELSNRLPSEQAATGLLGILNQLISPSAQAVETLDELGLTIEELRATIADKGLPAALALLGSRVKDFDQIAAIFPEVRGLNAFLQIFTENNERLAETLRQTANATGAADIAFAKTRKTFEFQRDLLKNQVNREFIRLGAEILPFVTRGFQGLVKLAPIIGGAFKLFAKNILTPFNAVASFGINIVKSVKDSIKLIEAIFRGDWERAWKLAGQIALDVIKAFGSLIVVTMGKVIDAMLTVLEFGLNQARGPLNFLLKQIESLTGINTGQIGEVELNLNNILGGDLSDLLGIEKVGQDAETTATNLKDLGQSIQDGGREAAVAKERLKELAAEFRKTSEAAAEIEKLDISKFFGEISKQLADALGIDAIGAGNIQGVDAVIRAQERAASEAFQFAAAIATVASAFERSASVANRIVLDMARAALEAQQAAAAALFARPTREVANLNLQLSNQRLNTSQLNLSNDPRIRDLQNQLKSIDNAIKAANKAASDQNKKTHQLNTKINDNTKKTSDNIPSLLDQLKIQNLMAEIAFERMIDQLDQLIDANKEQASKLQEVFLKANNDLQRQINEAIGRGDTEGALSLVDQQREQSKAYQEQAKALEKNRQEIERQQKQATFAERERERQARLAEALAAATEQNTEKVEENTEAKEQETEKVEANTDALEAQRDRINEEIDSIQSKIQASQDEEKAIQNQIDVFEAQTAVLRAMIDASDQTLLSQEEQAAAAFLLANQIRITSGQVRDLAQKTGQSLIPQIDESTRKFKLLQEMVGVITNQDLRQKFINQGIDPAARRLEILALTADKFEKAMNNAANAAQNFANKASQNSGSAGNAKPTIKPPNTGSGAIIKNAFGGIYSAPTLGILSENFRKEAVIPLESPSAAREIISQIPANLLGRIMPQQPFVFSPSISVSGDTLDTVEAMTIRTVQRIFRDARSASLRRGGLISSGIGPSV